MQRSLAPVIWNGFPPTPFPFSLALLSKHYNNTNLRKILMYVDLCIELVCCLFSWHYNPLWLYFPQHGSRL
jgi:hypothetical protein